MDYVSGLGHNVLVSKTSINSEEVCQHVMFISLLMSTITVRPCFLQEIFGSVIEIQLENQLSASAL